MRFQDKVVVITGAAGGIGLAAVRRFASEGARIVAVDLEGSDLDSALAEAEPFGVDALSHSADCSQAQEVSGYVDRCVSEFGRLDVLFNNAGIEGRIMSLLEYPEDDFDRVINVNLRGVWLGMKYAAPAMFADGGGAIVNTAATAGRIGFPSNRSTDPNGGICSSSDGAAPTVRFDQQSGGRSRKARRLPSHTSDI